MSKFSPEACDAVLGKVDMSQAGIQTASAKLLFWKRSATEVVRSWERAFQRADMDKRLSLIYLVNDVVQTSRRSGREYTEAFHKALPEAFRHMMKHSDEKVQQKLKKLVLVWRDRNVWGNKGLGLYLDMVRGVSLNASPEVRPNHQPPSQSVPDPVSRSAGLFRELQQAQVAVQHATNAESSKAMSLKDIPQGGMTLAQQQKIDEQVAALEKLVACRQKYQQIQEMLNKELQQLAESSSAQLQSCTQALQRDRDRLKELQNHLSTMHGSASVVEDVEAGLNSRSLASAGLPPSAPDLMSGSLATSDAVGAVPAPASVGMDAPYTPSAPVHGEPIAAAAPAAAAPAVATPARGTRRDPRGRESGGLPAAVAPAAAATPAEVHQVNPAEAVTQAEAAGMEDMDLAKTLASMAPAESAAILESIMRDAPAEIVQEFGTALVQQAASTQQPQG